jgi:hypothetical protein
MKLSTRRKRSGSQSWLTRIAILSALVSTVAGGFSSARPANHSLSKAPAGIAITLVGDNPLTVECGSEFGDPGAIATDANGKRYPVEITVPPDFVPSDLKLGSYIMTYSATDGTDSTSVQRTVNVEDRTPPVIILAGSDVIKIQQGSCLPFVDPGASANDGCAGTVAVSASISGPNGVSAIDIKTPGEYVITYKATDSAAQAHAATATRRVLVGDFPEAEAEAGQSGTSNPPTIKLKGRSEITVECGTDFIDPGATANAECLGAVPVIVSEVVDVHKPGPYRVTYSATNGTLTSVAARAVIVVDTTPPAIKLNGAEIMTAILNEKFVDPGAQARDLCAGEVPVTVSGAVDVKTLGDYTITYTATDGKNSSAKTRTVRVIAKP